MDDTDQCRVLRDARKQLAAPYPGALAQLLIPVRERDKRPIRTGWNSDALERHARGIDGRDQHLDVIAKHVATGGNVGLVVPPGFVALDAADEHGLAYCREQLPDAPWQRTAHGGHVIARLPQGVELTAEKKAEIAPGVKVDLRPGGKTQIVVEPSVHRTDARYV